MEASIWVVAGRREKQQQLQQVEKKEIFLGVFFFWVGGVRWEKIVSKIELNKVLMMLFSHGCASGCGGMVMVIRAGIQLGCIWRCNEGLDEKGEGAVLRLGRI